MLRLLGSRRLLPLLATQACGAFNDNLFKSAVVILVTFGTMTDAGLGAGGLSAIAGACLVAPFFLVSSLAGQMADRIERSRLLRWLKAAELLLNAGACAAILTDSVALALGMLFLLGAQAALSSPVKYALIPQHLTPAELVGGNALMEAVTFLAILAGTLCGAIAATGGWGRPATVLVMAAVGIANVAAAWFVPPAPAPSPGLRIGGNLLRETRAIVVQAAAVPDVARAIRGTSWFWLVGAVMLSQMPAFARDALGAGTGVVTLFLGAFSIGVGAGSVLAGRLLRGAVSARLAPWAALGMAVFSLDLWWAGRGATAHGVETITAFLHDPRGLRILADMAAIALSAGVFVVPLIALVQRRSAAAARARAIAAMNIANALAMTAASLLVALLLYAGLTVPTLFLLLALGDLAMAAWIRRAFRGAEPADY